MINDTGKTIELHNQLAALYAEHRDLDAVIDGLGREHTTDQLLLQRLKKRKLAIKDQITGIERMLEPDELA